MDYLVIVLRLIHVIAGIIWVGSALTMNIFIGPTVYATQESGQQFLRHLMTRTRFTATMTVSAILTIIAGGALIGRAAGAGSAWISSGPGIGFSIGAAFSLVAFVCGMLVGIDSSRINRLRGDIQGKPSAEQSARLASLSGRLRILGPINVYSLLIASILMAVARYLVF
jgi:uncharacterized membrane protein